jgi:hypothetical protein
MAFTSVDLVSGLYPAFVRGKPNQQPPDSYIQQFIDDTCDMLIAILERRFNEAISQVSTTGVNPWLASLGLPNFTWNPGQPVTMGMTVLGATQPLSCQICTVEGTTGSDYPSWNPVPGETTTDGSVTWSNIGQSRQFRVLERGNRYGAASQLGAIMASFGVAAAAKLAEEYKKADWEPFCLELNAETRNGKAKAYGLFDFLFDPLANVQTPRPLLAGVAGADQPYGIAPAQEGISSLMGKFGVDFGRQSGGTWNGGGGWNQ